MPEPAKSEGWNVDSVDYRGVNDARDRVTRLLSFCRDLRGDLALVGSSMGGDARPRRRRCCMRAVSS